MKKFIIIFVILTSESLYSMLSKSNNDCKLPYASPKDLDKMKYQKLFTNKQWQITRPIQPATSIEIVTTRITGCSLRPGSKTTYQAMPNEATTADIVPANDISVFDDNGKSLPLPESATSWQHLTDHTLMYPETNAKQDQKHASEQLKEHASEISKKLVQKRNQGQSNSWLDTLTNAKNNTVLICLIPLHIKDIGIATITWLNATKQITQDLCKGVVLKN